MRRFKVTLNGKSYVVSVEELEPHARAEETPDRAETAGREGEKAGGDKIPSPPEQPAPGELPLTAPLAGTVMAVRVRPGEKVQKGRVLLSMEALKMENEITAPATGVVEKIFVEAGAMVATGDILLTIRTD